MPYLEDAKIGEQVEVGSFTFTADLIKDFARQFDPQAFHLDEEAGKMSLFGGLAASGWHITAIWMKLTVKRFEIEAAQAIARGEKPGIAGPSPGFRNMRWMKPVLAGDTLTYVSEIKSARPSASMPKWGVVELYETAANQNGEQVFSFEGSVFLRRRTAET